MLLLLTTLITAGSVMLYRFYQNQNMNEIGEEIWGLDEDVMQTYFREYQRYYQVIQTVRQITAQNEEVLRKNLDGLLDIFGPSELNPGIIMNISYRNRESGNSYKKNADGDWQEDLLDEIYAPPLRAGNREIEPGDALIFNPPEVNVMANSKVHLIYELADQSSFLIEVELNWEDLEEQYVIPSLSKILEKSGFNWEFINRGPEPPEEKNHGPRIQRFMPFSALLGKSYNSQIDLQVPLPSPQVFRKPILIRGSINPDENLKEFLNEFSKKFDRENLKETDKSLVIGYEDAPFYRDVERKNALNWLQSMVILLGMAAVFLIMIIQLNRLSRLREKEKEFVASITHELRTPLTVIRAAAENLASGIIPEERVSQYGKLVKDQVLRLGNMIEEILLFSSMEGNNLKMEAVQVELCKLIDEVAETVVPLAREKGISLNWDRNGLPPYGMGDPDLIRLILNNLIMNALNHAYPAEPGVVRIAIRCSLPDSLLITVEDEGRGITASEQKKVFSPFYRDRFSRENQEKGSGLGLFICSKKAGAAGGFLKLESPYKRIDGTMMSGCRFQFRIKYMIQEERG